MSPLRALVLNNTELPVATPGARMKTKKRKRKRCSEEVQWEGGHEILRHKKQVESLFVCGNYREQRAHR